MILFADLDYVDKLPHLNAALNLLATCLLITGLILIKIKKETAHKITMLGCFAVSVGFLISYIIRHVQVPSKKFPIEEYNAAGYFYYVLLATHVVLAATVPFLAVITIVLGYKAESNAAETNETEKIHEAKPTKARERHRKLAKITFPIWLYVSITGVIIYLMLYWFFFTPEPAN